MNPERSTFKHLSTKDFGKPPTRQYNALQNLTKPHVDSFDQMLHGGLSRAAQNILPFEFSLPNGSRVSLLLQDAMIGQPMISPGNQHARTLKVFPAECRGRRTTYKAALQVKFYWTVNDKSYGPEERIIGEVPIMVKSAVCSLASLNPAKLIERGEEAQEMGGYFIVNGNERIIRMLIMPRRNFPLATCRPNWTKRGPHYTEYGITMRCVQPDETASQMVLHYLSNGAANLSFRCNKEQFFVPLIMILKALVNVKDRFIYQEMIKGVKESSYLKGCVSNMLRQAQAEGLATQAQVLKYIGERFRIKLDLPEWYSDRHIGEFLLKQCICTHLENNMEKFYTLVYMTKKLFALAKGECAVENSDNPMFQEVLLPGHLYQMLLKEKLEMWLGSVKKAILSRAEKEGTEYVLNSVAMVKALNHTSNVGKAMEYFMATGTLISKSGLGLMQNTGLTVVADKLNFMRYISHFRCVHRGSFFSEMRTTSVRKLLPEAWGSVVASRGANGNVLTACFWILCKHRGFMCPVHTPDGAPCGLLNHLTGSCEIVTAVSCIIKLPYILWENGMTSYDCDPPGEAGDALPVMLDGKMVGWISQDEAPKFVQQLRAIKVSAAEGLLSLKKTEIVLVPKTKFASQYPGVYLFTSTARFVRPVKNLAYNCVEMIGSFEQVYMNICVVPEEAIPEVTTHMEISENSILSAVASLTPFSDFNQSPRNMYQCQMGKQTMGTPLHAFRHRSDNKLYRIQTPQSALVRPYMYDYYHMDEYPSGTNAVVAVISYTGYDMEDAMILNKASYERGFGHGSIYKYEIIDLQELSRDKGRIVLKFGCRPDNSRIDGRLDEDGLPAVGTYLQFGDPYYSYINIQTGVDKLATFNSKEAAYVDHIKLLGDDKGTQELQKVCVCLRIPRNPTIGDKFSSRHGQKGICSQKWPVEDMPFTEKGMTPDIIFNPHGFPSRMTIGMMIESMAGKSASSHGLCHDATAFTFSEDQSAIEYFGEMLTAAGYNYYGTERMYSGINGLELEADIFIGVVYYQRLRHMVFDKFQVRTTGPVDILTHQPVKGRKMGGGVRFGEMERDALLAHGTSFLLQDRLLNCSDKSEERVCTKCGSLLSVYQEKQASSTAAASYEARRKWICKMCNRSDTVEVISLPFVFRYLVAELAAMNIKVVLDVGPVTSPVTSHEES